MQEAVITVTHISKYFEIYEKPSHRLLQMICRGRRCFFRPYQALVDVSFTVSRGECVGIIGRNGAGKSTLLQIITGTLRPTSGSVRVQGRVAALLELGSGFNPEFTGRENVYLNAAILGLSTREINERYDDILAFADIGSFINQPVKSYSSGMVVRLAFAVIAHVDADVLIVDEALSVGDAFFQQKCMRFLHRFMQEHTVLFVSHDTGAVNMLCNRAILLEQGRVKQMGDPQTVTEAYLRDLYNTENPPHEEPPQEKIAGPAHDVRAAVYNASNLRNDMQVIQFDAVNDGFGKGGATISNAWLCDSKNRPLSWVVGGSEVTLCVGVSIHQDMVSPIVGFLLTNAQGQSLIGENTFLTYCNRPLVVRAGQELLARFSFTMPVLPVGDYAFAIAVAEGTQEDHVQHNWVHSALGLHVVASSCATGVRAVPMQRISFELL